MKIEYQINFKEYLKLMFYLYYRKPLSIILLVLAVVISVQLLSSLFTGEIYFQNTSNNLLGLSMVIMIFIFYPILHFRRFKRNFETNKMISLNTVTEFTMQKFSDTAESVYAEVDWKNVYSVEELKSWFLFYQSATSFGFCPKRVFSVEQLLELRNIITVNKVKSKLRND